MIKPRILLVLPDDTCAKSANGCRTSICESLPGSMSAKAVPAALIPAGGGDDDDDDDG